MAKTTDAAHHPANTTEPVVEGGVSMRKLLLFGIPVFIVQLGVVYFVITRVFAPSVSSSHDNIAAAASRGTGGKTAGEYIGWTDEMSIYVVKDIIVNPAGTNGTRFLLTTVGFEVSSSEARKELEAKDVQLRDMLNTILTSKDLVTLSMVEQREPLRKEIASKVAAMLQRGTLNNVYFSKFIIQ
jgi:flagellar FliL protein